LKNKLIIFFICFFSTYIYTHSQEYVVNDLFLKTHLHILNFEKSKALHAIKAYEEANMGNRNLLMYYLESMIFFMDAFLSETNETKAAYDKKFNYWEKQFLSGDKKSPYYSYCLATLYLQRGLLHTKHSNYVNAGLDIRRASRLYERNSERFPAFVVQYKEQGLLYCFLGNIPEKMNWLLGLAGMKGSLREGEQKLIRLIELSSSQKEMEFLQLEASLYYATVAVVLYNDKKKLTTALRYTQASPAQYKKSPLYSFVRANLLSHLGKNNRALVELRSIQHSSFDLPFHYLDYFQGLLLLQRGDENAKTHFFRFVRDFHGIHYLKSAYQKIAWCYLLEGNVSQYDTYMTIARNTGVAVNDADKQADFEASKKSVPHVLLLRARLLTDGGYYNDALEIMNSIDSSEICKNSKHCVEYNYRFGRIADLQENKQEAIGYYLKVIEQGKEHTEYYAANAALMLGNIYEESKQFANARKYYNMCLQLPFEEYKNSIQQKAKAGLQRVGK
jgi:hypothetical protein